MSNRLRSGYSEQFRLNSFFYIKGLATLLLLLLAYASGVAAQTSQIPNLNGGCGADYLGAEWACNSSDIAISEIAGLQIEGDPTYCVQGQPLLIQQATVQYSINRQRVYDQTMYIGDQQGTDPRLYAGPGQSCSAFSLPGPFAATPSIATPWTDLDGDACGDSGASVTSASRQFTNIPITCQDNDGDGMADLQVLLTWDINAGAACGTGSGQQFPTGGSNSAKCDYSLRSLEMEVVPPGTLTVVKETNGGDDAFFFEWGRAANPTETEVFTLDTGAGPGTAQRTFQVVNGLGQSDFLVGEVLSAQQLADGWTFESAECVDQNESPVGSPVDPSPDANGVVNITIDSGDEITCTFVNNAPASLTVVKTTLGGNGVFEFSSDVPGLTPTFQLDTGTINTDDVTVDNIPIADPDNGASFTITETVPDGWQLVSASCTNGDSSVTESLDVTLQPGDDVTCTFTNGLDGSLTIVKNTLGGDGSFDFTSDLPDLAGGQFNITTANNTGAKSFTNALPAGTYSVTEVVPDGWDLTGLACNDNNSTVDPDSATATINIEIGESVTCTFTNTQRGVVEIVKATAPTGGTGFTFVSDIWNNQELPLDDGQTHTVTDLVPGQYTITETDPAPAFDLTELVCVDSETGGTASTGDTGSRQATINLDPGETVTCTFTNTERGSITIVKSVSDDGPTVTDFSFSSDIPGFESFILGSVTAANPAQTTAPNLVPGAYSVSEDGPPAEWALTGAACNDGSDPSAIDLAPGEDVVCTFVNSPLGSATIIKFTVGDDDTFDYVGSDPFDGLSLTTIDGAANGHFGYELPPAGNPYTVTEDPLPPGWSLTGLACVEDGTQDSSEDLASRTATINVDFNEQVTCTFTNTAGGTLIIRKETLPDGVDQAFTFSGEASGAIRDYSTFAEEIEVSGQPGTYTSAETVPDGWTVTGIACSGAINSVVTIGDAGGFDAGDESVSVDLAAGETVVCSFENTSEGGITIVKETVGAAGQFAFASSLGNFVIDTASDPDVVFQDLLPDSYLFSETVPAGWELTDISCTGATSSMITIGGAGGFEPGDQGVTIDLQDGELIICTFQNTQLVPDISLAKSASPTTFAAIGETITYTLDVTNSGTAPLTDVLVADPLAGLSAIDCSPQANPIANLAPGATVTCTATLTTTQEHLDAGRIDNTATATGSSPTGTDDVSDSASATVSSNQQPNIQIVKTPNPDNYSAPGEVITYTFDVSNSGNTTLTNVAVSDPLAGLSAIDCGAEANPIADLEPGETVSCSATLTITQAHVDAGQIDNTATATGSSPENVDDVTDSDSATVSSVALAGVSITKTPDPASYSQAGETITYTLAVTNNGGVTLSNVLVSDPLAGLSAIDCGAEANPIADLAPGETLNCTATLVTDQTHVDAGQIDNTAMAVGSPPGDAADVSDTASATVVGNRNPSLAIEKSSSTTVVTGAGQVIDYSYVVTNTGNVTLGNVMLTDDNVDAAPVCNPATPATLAPAEVMNCTAVHTVTTEEFDSLASIDNVATATSDLAPPVTDSLSIPVQSVQPSAPTAVPSLNRYGLALLILLILGMAAVTVRRFV